ncbi:MAG: glyoxalase/bleomycin resistance/extradiol dioxygenase family protein [Rhizobiales bacterium]|nr:glyoxalase/bleomycin resistance/extradiol dioxygenase family protein [Hyphomicrobiales bacterium]
MVARPALLEAALYADDLDAAERFYAGVLGLEVVVRSSGRHVFFRLEGAMLLVFDPAGSAAVPGDARLPVPPHGANGPGHVCLAASAAEIEGWRHKLTAAGVAIEADFDWPGGGRSIYFRDPAGNSIEIAEPRIWGFS